MDDSRPLSQRIDKPDEQVRSPRREPKYAGKTDYQGNHDIFEMPEDKKPSRLVPRIPVKKVLLVVILAGAGIVLALTFVEMLKQAGSLG